MAADNNKLSPLFLTFVLFFLLVSVSVSSSQCADGTYDHDGRTCCQCGVGKHLVEHCTNNLTLGNCESCEEGRYSNVPNHQMSCERCTSCSHPNENLVEDEHCAIDKDRTCRCKKDHFCVSQGASCKLCQPCTKCGEEGVKTPCADSSDTVCNEKTEGGNDHGRTVGIIVGVLLPIIVLAAVGVFIWKTRMAKKKPDLTLNGAPMMNLLPEDVDLQRHLQDIAEIIGWKDMRHVAKRSGMPSAKIESCEINHRNDVEEQTVELLEMWVQREGRDAPKNLIQMLKDSHKNVKAQEVIDILSRNNQNPPV